MAVKLKRENKYVSGVTSTMTYYPTIDGDLNQYIRSTHWTVEEDFPGEINKILVEQRLNKITQFTLDEQPDLSKTNLPENFRETKNT